MRVAWIQTAPFETLGHLEPALREAGADLKPVVVWKGEPFPSPQDYEILIFLGGPFGVDEDERLPWLRRARACIADALNADRAFIGICLGAQLLAQVAGAEVVRSHSPELGWHKLHPVRAKRYESPKFAYADPVFLWHQDIVLPSAHIDVLARSDVSAVQVFAVSPFIYGFQFHPEMDTVKAQEFALNMPAWPPGNFVQDIDLVMANEVMFEKQREVSKAIIEAVLPNC